MVAQESSHPVWSVYDRLRTARLNVKYYSRRLQHLQRWNVFVELVLIASAPTSAIAALWFWRTEQGVVAWRYLGAIAAIAAVLKPFFALPSKIKKFEGLVTGYRLLEYDLQELRTTIEQEQEYAAPSQAELTKAIKKERELVSLEPTDRPWRRLLRECQQEVLSELPVEAFFVPKE